LASGIHLFIIPKHTPYRVNTGEFIKMTENMANGKRQLIFENIPFLKDLSDNVQLGPEQETNGFFLKWTAEKAADRHVFFVGNIQVSKFTCLHRYEPFWMRPMTGTKGADVPLETQFILAELEGGNCFLMVPLLYQDFRCSLRGCGETGIELVAETGNTAVIGNEVEGLYVGVGADPFELIEQSARVVCERMGVGRLREEKSLPDFVDQFGWCTWDAFYQDVSMENIRMGLESFERGDVMPKVIILDDGWQSEHTLPTGERRLFSFAANKKFPGGLAKTVEMAKDGFDVEHFLVWHAITGYWGGVDGDAFPGYGVRSVERIASPGISVTAPWITDVWGKIVGLVSTDMIYKFFQDYHRYLRMQGVDGVKVDTQATLESVAHGSAGRVEMMKRYHEALEGSAHTHFQGNLINCMSCANDMLYTALNSNLTRTSTDFWPNDPSSHGLHLYTNALVSLWFSQFVHPDWDMFQSGHQMGAYHAAGRAVGGCPIYVSDKPDGHDFDLLRKLVLPDGSILRCLRPGIPTRDCIFHDPTKEDILLKIQNINVHGGILGVFNARWIDEHKGGQAIHGSIRPGDIEELEGETFAVYAHNADELRLLNKDEVWEITVQPLEYEIFTIMPVTTDFAPIGIIDMFNSGGSIMWLKDGVNVASLSDLLEMEIEAEEGAQGAYLTLITHGRFVAWSAKKPSKVWVDGGFVDFSYDSETGRMDLNVQDENEINLFVMY
jgi:raffinose synthase